MRPMTRRGPRLYADRKPRLLNKLQWRRPYFAQFAFRVAAEHVVSVLPKHIVQGVPNIHDWQRKVFSLILRIPSGYLIS